MDARTPKTLYDKIWDSHLVHEAPGEASVIYIDRHLVHEVTSAQAFEGLRETGRKVWRVSSIVATADLTSTGGAGRMTGPIAIPGTTGVPWRVLTADSAVSRAVVGSPSVAA